MHTVIPVHCVFGRSFLLRTPISASIYRHLIDQFSVARIVRRHQVISRQIAKTLIVIELFAFRFIISVEFDDACGAYGISFSSSLFAVCIKNWSTKCNNENVWYRFTSETHDPLLVCWRFYYCLPCNQIFILNAAKMCEIAFTVHQTVKQ